MIARHGMLAAALLAVTVWAWVSVVRDASSMPMAGHAVGFSAGAAAAFTLQWGVMMAAMMLPSASPTILLYREVSRRLSVSGDRTIPGWAFAAIYLLIWLLTGVAVYVVHAGVGAVAATRPAVSAGMPYALAATLALAGAYQLSSWKRACLRQCESPLSFFMTRWRSGYAATARMAVSHALYCVGCCWALMLILVAVGAMSIAWVLAITLAVFTEKVLPRGELTARVIGVALIVLGVAVAVDPAVAAILRGGAMTMQ